MTSFLPILLQPWFTNVVFQDAQLDLPKIERRKKSPCINSLYGSWITGKMDEEYSSEKLDSI